MTCHPRGKKYGHRTPPGPCVEMAERLRRSAPSPLGGAELFSEQGPGIVVVVVYQITPAKNPSVPAYNCRGLWHSSSPSARSFLRSPSPPSPSFTQSPSPPRLLVRDGQTSPQRPRLIVSRSTVAAGHSRPGSFRVSDAGGSRRSYRNSRASAVA